MAQFFKISMSNLPSFHDGPPVSSTLNLRPVFQNVLCCVQSAVLLLKHKQVEIIRRGKCNQSNPVLKGLIQAGFSILRAGCGPTSLGESIFYLVRHKTRLESGPRRLDQTD